MVAMQVTVLQQGKLLAEGTLEKVQEDEQVKQVYLGH
jgi:urea transport system ATP-binding protein